MIKTMAVIAALAFATAANAGSSNLYPTRVRQVLPLAADPFTHDDSAYETLGASSSVTSSAFSCSQDQSIIAYFKPDPSISGVASSQTVTLAPRFSDTPAAGNDDVPGNSDDGDLYQSLLGPDVTITGVSGSVPVNRAEAIIFPNGANSAVIVVTNNDSSNSIKFRLLVGGQ